MSGKRLELSPAWTLAVLIVALHAAAAAALLAVLPGLAGGLGAAAFVALGLAAAWSRALLRSGSSPRALELAEAQGTVELRDGRRLELAPAPMRHVSRFLVSLAAPRRTILLSRDMLDAESFRLLRLWALWGRLPVAAAQLRA